MDTKRFDSPAKFSRQISKGQISDCLQQMQAAMKGAHDQLLEARIESIADSYGAMLKFMVDGGIDPNLHNVYSDMQRRLLCLSSDVMRHKRLNGTFCLYAMCHAESMRLQDDTEGIGLVEELLLQLAECKEHDERYFCLHDSLFNCIFTSSSLLDSDEQTQLQVTIESLDQHLQAYLVSALTLSCLTFFCNRKMEILCHLASASDDEEVKVRALAGVMLIHNVHHEAISFFPGTLEAIAATMEDCDHLMYTLFEEWAVVCNTSDFRKMVEEKLMPDILKSKLANRHEIEDGAQHTKIINIELRAKDVDDDSPTKRLSTLERFIRLMTHGADTNFMTFSSMKRFDFFMMACHWLLPFNEEYPLVQRVTRGFTPLAARKLLLGSTLCSSDLYSVYSMLSLSSGQARESMFRALTQQVNFDEDMTDEEKSEALNEALSENLTPRRRIRSYLQDLYRFYNLHPSHEEFDNPFEYGKGLGISHFWRPIAGTAGFNLNAARFFRHIGKHTEAIEFYRRFLRMEPGNADALRELAICYQDADTPRPAVEHFRRAILAGADEEDCLRRICVCQMGSGNYHGVIETTDRLMVLRPDDSSIKGLQATALMKGGFFEQAYEVFHELEVEDDKYHVASRGAAWCLFRMRNYEDALAYYDRFMDTGEVHPEDLLNRAHTLWALGRITEAADSYVSHAHLRTEDKPDNLMSMFDEDIQPLIETTGITPDKVAMMRDYIKSRL